jgi:hypothetical protein
MNEVIVVITSVVAAAATLFVSHDLKQGPVRASAILSLAVAVIFLFFPSSMKANYLVVNIPLVFIGASFVGMTSKVHFKNWMYAVFSGLVFGLIFLGTQDVFNGFGGGLGAKACLSVLTTIGVEYLVTLVFEKIVKTR